MQGQVEIDLEGTVVLEAFASGSEGGRWDASATSTDAHAPGYFTDAWSDSAAIPALGAWGRRATG